MLQQPGTATCRVRAFTACALVALLLATAAATARGADIPLADPALAAQRVEFLAAERALAHRQRAQFEHLLKRLDDYPLLPYLQYDDITSRLAAASDAEVAGFLTRYAGSPLAARLRTQWLQRIGARHDWKRLLVFWRRQSDATLLCLHAHALLATGHVKEGLAAAAALWLSGHSRPDECDPAFRALRRAGQLGGHLLWSRIRLAIDAGDSQLAGYLSRMLPADQRVWVRRWLRVRADPERVGEQKGFQPALALSREIRLYGLKRLALRHPDAAAAAWEELPGKGYWSAGARGAAIRAIALGFAQEHMAAAGRWLARVPRVAVDRKVREWRVLVRLRARDWAQALSAIEALRPDERDTQRWHYWRARCLAALGHEAAARKDYLAIAGERSFFGFLAADHVDQPYHFAPKPLHFTQSELEATAHVAAVRRARELQVLGRTLDSRREWYTAVAGMDQQQLLRAARLAQMWGWNGRAILTIARANYYDDLRLRFPIVYPRVIRASAAAQGMDPAWLLAVARQESAFVDDARSPAGALGLMQLMPRTGRLVAHWLSTPYHGASSLLNPTVSIRLGARYLRSLLDRFQGNTALAIAAYNAGPRHAEHWRPDDGSMAADIWIATVPYHETRAYLQRVLTYTAIYDYRLGLKPMRLSKRAATVPARGSTVSAQRRAGGGRS